MNETTFKGKLKKKVFLGVIPNLVVTPPPLGTSSQLDLGFSTPRQKFSNRPWRKTERQKDKKTERQKKVNLDDLGWTKKNNKNRKTEW